MQIKNTPIHPNASAVDPLAGLEETLERARIHCGVSGMSFAVVHKGEIIFAKGFGKRNQVDPFTPETLVPVASMTKAFTTAAIGELVAEGKMDWSKTPVNKYLPEFELKDPALTAQLTLDDLLSHRTGLPDVDTAWVRNPESRMNLIKRFRHVEAVVRPRTHYIYNNALYGVAGEAAAQVAGVTYEELVSSKVLQPLGMTQTGFSAMEMRKKENYAMPNIAPSFEDAQKGTFEQVELDEIPMAYAPTGDLHTNVMEMAVWARVMMHQGKLGERQVLNKESVGTVLSAHTIMSKSARSIEFGVGTYGLGWMIDSYKGQVVHRHTGTLVGFRSNITLFPNADLAVIHLTNTCTTELPVLSPYYIADQILSLPKTQDWLFEASVTETQKVYDRIAMGAKGNIPEKIPNKPAQHASSEYVGEYSDPIYGDLTIFESQEDGGGLELKMRMFRSKLEHLHFEIFKVVLKDDGFAAGMTLTFRTAPSGRVDALQFKDQDVELLVFTKKMDVSAVSK